MRKILLFVIPALLLVLMAIINAPQAAVINTADSASGATSDAISDSIAAHITTTIGDPGSDVLVPSEQAAREGLNTTLYKTDMAESLRVNYKLLVGTMDSLLHKLALADSLAHYGAYPDSLVTVTVKADSSGVRKNDGSWGFVWTWNETTGVLDGESP